MDTEYVAFVNSKRKRLEDAGFVIDNLPEFLFNYQKQIVTSALKRGRFAVFAECGLGKTPMQLVWADKVAEHTGKPVLILAPLAVAAQTVREGQKFGIDVHHSRDGSVKRITITNYEHIDKYHSGQFAGIVLDESSILKNYAGKLRNEITAFAKSIPYRLSATATPAPNDFVEFGTQAEFLSICTHTEMLANYFVHDGGDTSKWRLKKHAVKDFKRWLNEWSITIDRPQDLGDDLPGFELPELREIYEQIDTQRPDESLFEQVAISLAEQRQQKRKYADDIAAKVAAIANGSQEQWLIWVENNYEADAISDLVSESVEIRGSDKPDHKEKAMLDFAAGKIRVLITKPSIAGFGMNWQQCNNMIFSSLSHSYEQRYQAIRRCYRFGQTKPVNVYTVRYHGDDAISVNFNRKQTNADHIKSVEA
jgi:superfamily II DNA or RNA helicase